MSAKQVTKLNWLKWGGILLLFVAGLAANYYYRDIALPIRIIGWIVLFGILLGLATLTAQGKVALAFTKEARMELRKVVWPNRQETVQTTMMLIAIVLVMALLMWAADSFFLWAVGWLTGQRG